MDQSGMRNITYASLEVMIFFTIKNKLRIFIVRFEPLPFDNIQLFLLLDYYLGKPGEVCKSAKEVIRSQAECTNAIGQLWPTSVSFWTGPADFIPSGCSRRNGGDNQPHFETSPTGVGRGRHDMIPVCKKRKYLITICLEKLYLYGANLALD